MQTDEKKFCTACNSWFDLSNFYRSGAGRLSSHCRDCRRSRQLAKRQASAVPGVCRCGRELRQTQGRVAKACIVCRGLADECACGRPKTKVAQRCRECCRETARKRFGAVCPGCDGRKGYNAISCRQCMYPGRRQGREGYVHVRDIDGRWRPEHQVVMERYLGRALLPGENVHHRNGVRDDNRPENLELWAHSQPHGQRVVDLVAYAHEILGLYGDHSDPSDHRAAITLADKSR